MLPGNRELTAILCDGKKTKNTKESWELLRASLGVTRDSIEYIKELADPIRHGEWGSLAAAERVSVLKTTWNIVSKFVKVAGHSDLLLPGEEPMPPEEAKWVMPIEMASCACRPEAFPHVAITQNGEPMVTIGRENDRLWLSLKCYSADGRIVAEIIRNQLYLNEKNSFRITRTQSRVTLHDGQARLMLDVNFVNPWKFRIGGNFCFRNGVPITIDDEILKIGNHTLSRVSFGTFHVLE